MVTLIYYNPINILLLLLVLRQTEGFAPPIQQTTTKTIKSSHDRRRTTFPFQGADSSNFITKSNSKFIRLDVESSLITSDRTADDYGYNGDGDGNGDAEPDVGMIVSNDVGLTVSTSTTTPSRSSSSSIRSSVTTLDRWQRRLITPEDPLSVHKLASIGYTATSSILLLSAAYQALQGEFQVIPLYLEPIMNLFTISNIIMCTASVRMAMLYRKKRTSERNAFLGTAISSLFSGYFLVWISPFSEGDIFYNTSLSRACFALLVGLNMYFIADTLIKQDDLIEGRRDRKAQDYQGRIMLDRWSYIFPVAFGMPLIAITGYLASVAHDRQWFLQQCTFIDQSLIGSGMQSHIFYQQLSTSLAASYASLFVTLRDKMLITKNQEIAGIAFFALPSFVWSAYTTYFFLTSLFMTT